MACSSFVGGSCGEKELAVRARVSDTTLGGTAMTKYEGLAPEERARITDIQDSLIERFVEHKEAIEEGREVRAKELEGEISELQREKENVTKWTAAGSA
jgi:hypothetical protein